MDHIIKSSEDVGEVVFGQPEEKAGTTGPDGSVLNRRREDDWLEDTEPYHGARLRTDCVCSLRRLISRRRSNRSPRPAFPQCRGRHFPSSLQLYQIIRQHITGIQYLVTHVCR